LATRVREAPAALIRVAAPATCIVAVSMYADAHYLQRMLAAGAKANVLKNEAGADLIQAIRAAVAGETFISPALAQARTAAVQRNADLDQALLTGREREVLRLLAQGWRTKEVADSLGISAKTVETYRARIMMKRINGSITDLPDLSCTVPHADEDSRRQGG
jgi:DNA-binding NarL/FixJ family response regulator